MTNTVLVTGATGLLGRQVVKAFETAGWDVVGTGWTRANPPTIRKVNLEDADEIRNVLDEVKSGISLTPVRHRAANRFPDKCDADPEGTRRINVEATKTLAEATNARSILLIYISSDYVFPGRPGEAPYSTDATPSPPNFYGQTKLDGEHATLSATGESGLGIVLRVPVLYGEATDPKESAINILLEQVWKSAQDPNAKINMDDWAIRYPTNTEDVARVIKDVTNKYLNTGGDKDQDQDEDRKRLPKIVQFSSEDHYTKYEICQMLADIMGLSVEGMSPNKQGNDPGNAVQRPYDCHLSTQSLKDIGVDVSTQNFRDWWRREVRAYRK
ncbi:MAG: 54S ribosomal protein L39, mitochondrial [Watsoniomyces obsoletus]|nr:MAG: 54S ribosomal protein L39, mitochondrial [Watsoniomyces obsoletus]